MKLSEFIEKLQKLDGDLEVIKINTVYDRDGYATYYHSDETPGVVESTGEDFGIDLEGRRVVIIW